MHLRTFGGLRIEADAGEGPVPNLGPRHLALLAVVAAAGRGGITREKVLGILWAESGEEQARHTLSQTLYRLKREAGTAWITGTTHLRLDSALASDIHDFQQSLEADQLARAAALYTGPFLEGFYLTGASEFEQWVEQTRARLQSVALKALDTLARRAASAHAFSEATQWWERLCEFDPFNATYAAGRIRALVASGERPAALIGLQTVGTDARPCEFDLR